MGPGCFRAKQGNFCNTGCQAFYGKSCFFEAPPSKTNVKRHLRKALNEKCPSFNRYSWQNNRFTLEVCESNKVSSAKIKKIIQSCFQTKSKLKILISFPNIRSY